ncbi:subtilosin A family bacteriocin [Bacillus subtilis]|nr:subtilosin A family bacteriocin [Bacillus subtilis]
MSKSGIGPSTCLVDGPIPDFEIAGATGLFGLWG